MQPLKYTGEFVKYIYIIIRNDFKTVSYSLIPLNCFIFVVPNEKRAILFHNYVKW